MLCAWYVCIHTNQLIVDNGNPQKRRLASTIRYTERVFQHQGASEQDPNQTPSPNPIKENDLTEAYFWMTSADWAPSFCKEVPGTFFIHPSATEYRTVTVVRSPWDPWGRSFSAATWKQSVSRSWPTEEVEDYVWMGLFLFFILFIFYLFIFCFLSPSPPSAYYHLYYSVILFSLFLTLFQSAMTSHLTSYEYRDKFIFSPLTINCSLIPIILFCKVGKIRTN